MGNITGRFLLPHPPLAIPEIGREETKVIQKTLDGLAKAGEKIAALKPKTIVMITPHGPCFSRDFYLPASPRISGDMAAFGAKKLLLGFDTDVSLAKALSQKAANSRLSAVCIDEKELRYNGFTGDLDHGVIVPLYFIRHFYDDFKLLPISLSGCSGRDHYRLGVTLRDCIKDGDDDVVIIASGDLSHKLSADAPYGYAPEGEIFDSTVRKLLLNEDSYGMLTLDPKLKEKAGQCGLDSYRMLLGTLDGFDYLTDIFSYEAPFGVGYLTAFLQQGKAKESALTIYDAKATDLAEERQKRESAPVKLARQALTAYLKDGNEIGVPNDTPPFLTAERGGVFVTIKNDGQLRGCIGTMAATQPTLAEEIIANATSAGTKDDRFAPVTLQELNDLSFSVSILGALQEVKGNDELDPKRYGIMVESKEKRGVLLPDLEGVDTVEKQIEIAREKAGIHPWRALTVKRFTVTNYE